ncbi:hypothetical protein [Candidatus Uabimicrobium sp. HlEnr_7]|uniref:hypothetical protein n=1 Tax=Candidatus Uabimicrobium helgolandensis TaxID=3095367 RepID=UPI00355873C0
MHTQHSYIQKLGNKSDEQIVKVITDMGNKMAAMRCSIANLGTDLCLECIEIIEKNQPSQEAITSLLQIFEEHAITVHHLDHVHYHFLAWCISRGHFKPEQKIEKHPEVNEKINDQVIKKIFIYSVSLLIVFSSILLYFLRK